MKKGILQLLTLIAALGTASSYGYEYDWTVDPRPYSERTTRLVEIAVHRYVPQGGSNVILERRYLLTAAGLIARTEDVPVPTSVAIPERAFNKVLVSASAWLAYGRLGPRALANFRLVNDLDPIDIAGRWHYEVALAEGAQGFAGRIPNLSSRADVAPMKPLIGGFVVTEMPRTVLIRAVGPGLQQFGVTNAAPAARLSLYSNEQNLANNEDWAVNVSHRMLVERATERVGAFPLPVGSRDAAIVITLPPGAYTVHAGGAALTSGTVLLEVYLLD